MIVPEREPAEPWPWWTTVAACVFFTVGMVWAAAVGRWDHFGGPAVGWVASMSLLAAWARDRQRHDHDGGPA